jgi:integrase
MVGPMTLTEWAADHAAGLPSTLGDRWAHVQGVVRQAHRVAAILPPEEREVLVAAAYLHDLRHTGGGAVDCRRRQPQEVAARAGHASVSFTLDRYGTCTRRPT